MMAKFPWYLRVVDFDKNTYQVKLEVRKIWLYYQYIRIYMKYYIRKLNIL